MRKGQVVRLLTRAQHISAVGLGVFAGLHLAVPVFAAVAGEPVESGSRVMMLGRVYYQSAIGEPLLYAAAGVHLLSGLVKRVLTKNKRISWHSIAGILLTPILAHHVFLNRLVPSRDTLNLSPTELDLSYVTYGLETHPFLTWTLYALLLGTGIFHALEGTRKMLHKRSSSLPFTLSLTAVVSLGLYRLGRDSIFLPSHTLQRIAQSYKVSFFR